MLERLKELVGRKAQDRKPFISGTVRPSDTYTTSRAPQRQEKAIKHLRGYVYAAAMLNARSIASQPLRLYARAETRGLKNYGTKRINRNVERYLKGDASVRPAKSVMTGTNGGGDVVEIYDHPVLDLLANVSPFIDGYQFNVLRKIMLQATGNEYLHPIIGPTGYPIEIHVLPSQLVKIEPTRDEHMIEAYLFGYPPHEVRFEPDEVLHNKTPDPEDPFYGRGWVSAAEGPATLLESMDDYEHKLFENHARPDWGIFLKDNLNETQWNRMVAYIDQNLRGNHNAGRPYIFEGGSDARPLQFSPRDLSFSEGELRKVEAIAAISGVPVSLLRANDPNLASAEVGFASYMRDTIHPYLVSDCEFLNQSLLPLFGDLAEDLFLAYDNPVAEDEERSSRIYLSEVSAGVRSINEARSELGLDPVDDGEELRVNGVPLSLAGQAQPVGDPFAAFAPSPQEPQAEEAEATEETEIEDATPQEVAVDTGQTAAQDAALNGAQIQQLLAITDKVNLGELTADAGFAIALAAFPGIPNERLADIFNLTNDKSFSRKSIRAGSFVEWRTPKGNYVGKVERIQREGTADQVVGDSNEASDDNPIAHVRVFVRLEDGTFEESDREVPVAVERLDETDKPEIAEKAVSEEVKDALKKKVEEHNEEVGDAKSKRATLRMLVTCYERGIGAYASNPGSVRPTVGSAEQWAMARVNGLLHALRTGKFKKKPFDTDLLPEGHPHATDGKKSEIVVPVEGPDGKVTQYGDVFTDPAEAMNRAEALGCDGIHEHDGEEFGHDGPVYMPCDTHAEYEEAMRERTKNYDFDFTPPKGVQEEAERGLEWRREHNRGGTEVGVARARDLSNGVAVSPDTVRRMANYFSRHESDKDGEGFKPGEDGFPSAGRIAWALWGGDEGKRWADSLVDRMNAQDERGEKVTRRENESLEDCVARGVETIVAEGKTREQAIAIAYSQCETKSLTRPIFKTCTGLEEGIVTKSANLEDWHPTQKAARLLVEEIEDDEDVGAADEGVKREGEPKTPATNISREIAKILKEQRERVLEELKKVGEKSVAKKSLSRADIARILALIAGDTTKIEQAVVGPMLSALDAGAEFAGEQLGQAANEALFRVVNDNAVEYAKTHAASLARGLQESTIDALRGVISRGVEQGFGVDKITDEIVGNGRLFTQERAQIIARTETARAFNEGNLETFKQVPTVAGKQWLVASNPCRYCREASEQTKTNAKSLDDPFVVDVGKVKVRRVEVQAPPLHPNCRCGLLSVRREVSDD
jgi:HK97 family phage portal protein